eukprot:TRINITY_DN9099_c0_g1_i1.p1 TRINITY_DN9099_c0_g1~~TRINITY_DN9099_c0_g1_i1.p1  ORF type:complete len:361 (+),score=75.97 TRINITY_DN9099_c0_g1_i1:3-1085(+)
MRSTLVLFFFFLGLECTPSDNAELATQAFLNHFWTGNYLNNTFPSNGKLTAYWTFAQGFDAVLDAAERDPKYIPLIREFFEGQNPVWIDGWYDDENWMAMALLRGSDLLKEVNSTVSHELLKHAILLWDDIYAGWDTTCCGSKHGGIWWDKAHTSKATASNAGPIILSSRLYSRSNNDTKYLNFAIQVFDFWWENMVLSNGHVCDNRGANGQVNCVWKFTYNEGLMIGATTELFKVTGDASYLEKAKLVIHFLMTNQTTPSAYGDVLFDGSGCGGDCMEFKGPAFRYLTDYYLVSQDDSVLAFLQSNVEALWNLARRHEDTMFAINWAGPAPSIKEVIVQGQQNVAVMALNLYAKLVSFR